MVDTIQELSDLSRKLNQKSDQLNALISSMNRKLAQLNFGVEVWLEDDPIAASDYEDWDSDNDCRMSPERGATLLGYCDADDGWQLAVRATTLVTKYDKYGRDYEEAKNSQEATPLLKAPRKIRVQAMRLIPALLDVLRDKAAELLENIEKAEKAAEKL
jgi:hypothetical protein